MSGSVQPPVRASGLQRAMAFARLGRPLHLAGGFVFNGLGIAIALFLGASIDWGTVLWCQLAITATQLMTHYSNDYFDRDADAAATTLTRWSGGSRMLPEGLIHPQVAFNAALLFGGVALVAAVVLAMQVAAPGWTLLIFLLSLFLAWNYSSPPLWLNRRGLGEITGAVLVPGLTTLLGFQVQAGRLDPLPVLAVVPLCFFQLAMLLGVGFPDTEGDVQVNKRTLVVVLGAKGAGRVFVAALALGYLALPLLVLLGLPIQVALAVALTLPIALWLAWRVHRGAVTDPAYWDALGFWCIGLLMAAAMLEIVAFLAMTLAL